MSRRLFSAAETKRSSLQAILSTLQAAKPSNGGSLRLKFARWCRECATRTLRIVSDCFGDLDDFDITSHVRARGHDGVMHVCSEEIHFDFRTGLRSVAGSRRASDDLIRSNS